MLVASSIRIVCHRPQIPREHLEPGVRHGTVGQELVEAARRRRDQIDQALGGPLAGTLGRHIQWTRREIAVERRRGHEPALDQMTQAGPQTKGRDRPEHERHIGVTGDEAVDDRHRAVEGLVEQPRDLGLVRHREPGVRDPPPAGTSRSSDRQKASIVVISISASRSVRSRHRDGAISPCAAAARRLPTIRSRISAAALRVKVMARMLAGLTEAFSQVEVAVREHRGLARTRGRLQDHVVGRVDRKRARRSVVTRHERSPSGRSSHRRRYGRASSRPAAAGSHPIRCPRWLREIDAGPRRAPRAAGTDGRASGMSVSRVPNAR